MTLIVYHKNAKFIYSTNSDLKELLFFFFKEILHDKVTLILQDFIVKDVQIETCVALENTNGFASLQGSLQQQTGGNPPKSLSLTGGFTAVVSSVCTNRDKNTQF